MKKHFIISLVIIAIFISIPLVTHAAVFINTKVSFGGKVLMTSIPSVTCTGSGTGPVVLMSIKGLPYYTQIQNKSPQSNDWILGNTSMIPNFSTCQITIGPYKIPFPVHTTNDYNISGSSSFGF